MNLLMWTDTLSDEMLPLLDELKEIGYDAVELPAFDLDKPLPFTGDGE
jgi:D-psicose/D-tagatose/L-ribulose 3-epimerase